MSNPVATPIALPIYGLNTREDQDDIPRGYSRSMVNAERRGTAVVKAKGKLKINSSAALAGAVVQGGIDYQTAGGIRIEIIHGAGQISRMQGATETVLETFGAPTAIIRGEVFMGQLYLTNGVDVVKITDGNTISLLPDAPQGKLIHLYNDHLFIANVPDDTNGPSKLYNSALRDPTSWSSVNVYNLDTNNAEEITALFTLRGYLGVAKNDSISFLRGNFFDALSDSFDAVRLPVETGIGIVSQGTCVKDDSGNLYYLNEGGFYQLSSPGAAPRLISGAISGTVNAINFGVAHLFTAVQMQAMDEIWWCVAVNGSATPNMILRYSMRYPTPGSVGAWWPLNLANVRSIWGFENGTDTQQIRGGDNAGYTYNMNTTYYDNTGSYDSFFVMDNVRHRAGGYGAWDWLITRIDNAGNWNVNIELYPGGIRNSPHVVSTSTVATDDSDPTFFNRQTVERQIRIAGVTANTLGIKVYNNTGGQNYGMHELAAMVRPLGMFR